MPQSMFDVVVVGAGQAGLGISYFLQQAGRKHIVYERGRIGESWLSQRWDSFTLNTPNAMNVLPGLPYEGPEPDGFWMREEFIAYFRRYVERLALPVVTGVTVLAIERSDDGRNFVVETLTGGQAASSVLARAVVVASGSQQSPKLPPVHTRIPGDVLQLHTSAYRNAAALPPGAVVIVGSGQSGCQIAEDLLAGGRQVYLCTSKVGRAPRRYRGQDIVEWLLTTGFWDQSLADLGDPAMSRAPQPQISGVGRHGHSVSLQHLSRAGAVILGRLVDVQDHTLVLGDDAAVNVRFADEASRQMKDGVDAYIAKTGITAPPPEEDPADVPDPEATCASPLRELNLDEANVSTIIWSTGFTGDFHWIHLPVLDASGQPIHQRGVSPAPGLYFLGFPWLSKRKSGIICGIAEDAAFIADQVATWLDSVSA